MSSQIRCLDCGDPTLTHARSQVVRVSVVLGPGETLPLRPASIVYCSTCGSWRPAEDLTAPHAPARAAVEHARAFQ